MPKRFTAVENPGEFWLCDAKLPGFSKVLMVVKTMEGAEKMADALNTIVAINPDLIGNAKAANGGDLKVHFGVEKIMHAVGKALGVQMTGGSWEPAGRRRTDAVAVNA